MVLKNFFFKENWLECKVAGMKIAFLPFLTGHSLEIWGSNPYLPERSLLYIKGHFFEKRAPKSFSFSPLFNLLSRCFALKKAL